VEARGATRAVHAQGAGVVLDTGSDHVLGLLREHAGERLLVLANLTAHLQPVGLGVLDEHGMRLTGAATGPDGRVARATPDAVLLEPYQVLWLRDPDPA
jgi:hypothetical protein